MLNLEKVRGQLIWRAAQGIRRQASEDTYLEICTMAPELRWWWLAPDENQL